MPQPADVAFVFLDLQKDIVPAGHTQAADRLRIVGETLSKFANAVGAPVFVSVVPFGNPEPVPIDEISRHGAPITIARAGPKLFAHQASVAAIASLGRKTLVLSGVLTEVVVLHAALGAIALGYEAYVMIDACSGASERTEAAAIAEMKQAGVLIVSSFSFLTDMIDEFATETGGHVVTALQSLLS